MAPRSKKAGFSKVQKPVGDTFELAQNDGINKEFVERVKRMRLWQEFLAAAYGIKLSIDYTIPLFPQPEKISRQDTPEAIIEKNELNAKASLENDKYPEVFLTRYMTDISYENGQPPTSPANSDTDLSSVLKSKERLHCAYQHMCLHYKPENNSFTITGLRGDLLSQQAKDDEVYANKVLFENIKAALILAQSAKAAGWYSVNFGNTTDPAKRYALQIACEYAGLDCSSEKVDLTKLPQTCHEEKLSVMIKYSLQEFLPSMNDQIWPDEPTPKAENDDFDVDFEALEAMRTSNPAPHVSV